MGPTEERFEARGVRQKDDAHDGDRQARHAAEPRLPQLEALLDVARVGMKTTSTTEHHSKYRSNSGEKVFMKRRPTTQSSPQRGVRRRRRRRTGVRRRRHAEVNRRAGRRRWAVEALDTDDREEATTHERGWRQRRRRRHAVKQGGAGVGGALAPAVDGVGRVPVARGGGVRASSAATAAAVETGKVSAMPRSPTTPAHMSRLLSGTCRSTRS